MELTREHPERIKDSLPVERGNVSVDVLSFLHAVLYVAKHGCKWRRLPTSFGNWHTIYTRQEPTPFRFLNRLTVKIFSWFMLRLPRQLAT